MLRRVFSVDRESVCKAEIFSGDNVRVFPVEGTGLVGVIEALRVKFNVRLLALKRVESVSVSLNSSIAVPATLSIFTLLVLFICPRFRASSIVEFTV